MPRRRKSQRKKSAFPRTKRPAVRRRRGPAKRTGLRRMSKRRFAKFLIAHSTRHEDLLWGQIRAGKVGVAFLRQVPISGWIADFLSREARLLIEVDGRGHKYGKQLLKDLVRDQVLGKRGFRTLRFTNEEVENSLDEVVGAIRLVAAQRMGRA